MVHKSERVTQYYSYITLTTAMDRHKEAVDVYSVLKPVFFVSKILGLSPYNAVGDIGKRRIIVSVSALINSIGMLIVNVGVFAYRLIEMDSWENICNFGGNIQYTGTLCHAVSAYFTCLFGCRQTARQFERLNNLIGKTYYSAWRKELLVLLAMQILCAIVTVIAGVVEFSPAKSEFRDSHKMLVFMFYYVTDLVGFMSEHQFVAFMHVLKRTVQNWNNHIDATSKNDVIYSPLYKNETNRRKSVLFVVSNNSVTSKNETIYSKMMHFKQLTELHACACDIAESVNAVYSPMLLMCVAKSSTSLTHILYYILYSYFVQKTNFFCKLTGNESYFVWLIYSSVRLFRLVYCATSTAKEVSHNVLYFNCLTINVPKKYSVSFLLE
jgi:hypothetical protein